MSTSDSHITAKVEEEKGRQRAPRMPEQREARDKRKLDCEGLKCSNLPHPAARGMHAGQVGGCLSTGDDARVPGDSETGIQRGHRCVWWG